LRLGINLRGDLAKFQDDELASHFERCVTYREWLASHAGDRANRWFYESGLAMPFGRGPLHARVCYRLMGFLYGGSWNGLNGRSLGDLFVLDCEIKDIVDEMKRRARARRQ
jgi:hypothetical protein